jgi:hypothetical protein
MHLRPRRFVSHRSELSWSNGAENYTREPILTILFCDLHAVARPGSGAPTGAAVAGATAAANLVPSVNAAA